MKLYVIGSLRNPNIPKISEQLRKETKWEIFDDWYAAGPEADDKWMQYEQGRGRAYADGLAGYAATHVYQFDKHHLDTCDGVLLVLPAGKSGHLELGYCLGLGKPGYILLEAAEPERWDVMYKFATKVLTSTDELIKELN